MPDTAAPVRDDAAGHAEGPPEAPDIRLTPVLLTGLFIVVFVGLTLAGMRLYRDTVITSPNTEEPRTFAGPALQRDPQGDLARLLADQRRRLDAYAWVDRAHGIARMPIAEAMRRLAGRGAEAYAAPLQPERVPPLGSRGGAASPLQPPGSVAAPVPTGEAR
ncbi:hypothetical protein [Methylobacterium nonmethylotrophicum]|uniref:Uncharacterized protein n=1 Tax=Methylobacterium nonmethylotrophicum TaxID=1141884 RepID=A0A4Z0NFX7_9HYPH|nr:hypothetical protein [Methylobacterium nonmethylotrophicum]TGD94843.1 hypothetical protein EU555_30800 [Methylobacterium nonmethylotrophicum]